MADAWEQLRELLTAATAADVITTLAWDRTPLGTQLSDADGYYAGETGTSAVWDALRKADWHTTWSGGQHFYVMRAPGGDLITYFEGSVYRGDRSPRS